MILLIVMIVLIGIAITSINLNQEVEYSADSALPTLLLYDDEATIEPEQYDMSWYIDSTQTTFVDEINRKDINEFIDTYKHCYIFDDRQLSFEIDAEYQDVVIDIYDLKGNLISSEHANSQTINIDDQVDEGMLSITGTFEDGTICWAILFEIDEN